MMISDDLGALIRGKLGFEPTDEQNFLISRLSRFLLSRDTDSMFLLKGYAGTGKTSVVAALVRALRQLRQPVMLLAPTGRAAKVFSLYAEVPAYTIHKRIYRQKSLTDMDSFQASVNLHQGTLFIVDEASMIANEGLSGSIFGTGRLLDDLVHYVYSCPGCRLVLVGDTAQLPPVGEEESPALCAPALSGYGMQVSEVCLTQVVRQTQHSGILWNATMLRQMLQSADVHTYPQLCAKGFPDVVALPGDELIDALDSSYRRCGTDGTIVITRSNKRANLYNNGIRARILDYEEELSGGDLVLVSKNNYYWTESQPDKDSAHGLGIMPFIANGDVAVVRRIRHERCLYGHRFVDATLRFTDYDNKEMDVTLLLTTLQSEAPALTRQQQEELFNAVWEDYPEIKNKADRIKKIKHDIYYNALQVKYAYAVTCHKAQGGQWQHVYIDHGYLTPDMLGPDYFRWLYTALTRATERVYLVNWPRE